jgi:O-methyltransferase involved in polyketide biosynthesis
MYLLEDAVGDTLGWIAANAAPTSTILFDYTYDAMIQMAKDMANINLDGFPGRIRQAVPEHIVFVIRWATLSNCFVPASSSSAN